MFRKLLILLLAVLTASIWASPAAQAGEGFVFTLDGTQEVPPVDTEAAGSCAGILNDEATQFQIHCTHNVENVVAAHIHRAPPGVNGGIIFPFDSPQSPITDTWDLSPNDVAHLLAGNLYVNVHSQEHMPGEIRGQIRIEPPANSKTMQFAVSGMQEVPPVDTDARGRCLVQVDDAETTLEVTCVHDVQNVVAAHIHEAERGVNGDIVFPFDDPTSPIIDTVDLTDPENDGLLEALRAGELYVNVHSQEHMPGEIRGQIDYCFSGENALCLQQDRFRVEVEFETMQETRAARAVPQQADSGMFWFFQPDNLELLVKVVNGCAINDRFWVFFSGTTNVGFTVTVTDTWTDEVQVYQNPLGQVAETVTDANAFNTCP